MPGARWFAGAQVNYAQQVLRHVDAAHAAGFPAIVCRNEKGAAPRAGLARAARQVASLALHLQAQGVQPGDRVAAYLPNMPETMVAFLAVVSLGGVWCICSPDMGTVAVLDRFRQIEPKVLIACDGVTYGGRDFDRTGVVAELRAALPSVRHLVVLRNLGAGDAALSARLAYTDYATAIARDDAADRRLRAGVAAVRPPAVDRLLQRHHRPAQADRARPRRHRDGRRWRCQRCTTTSAAATTPTAGASASTGTAPPAGSCGTRRSAACCAAPPSASSTATPAAGKRRAGLDHAVALCGRRSASPSSAPARPSSPTA